MAFFGVELYPEKSTSTYHSGEAPAVVRSCQAMGWITGLEGIAMDEIHIATFRQAKR